MHQESKKGSLGGSHQTLGGGNMLVWNGMIRFS